MPLPLARRIGLATAAALALLAAPASAATVTSAKLDWTTKRIYDFGQPRSVDHTWLGYATGEAGVGLAGGTATPSDGATGPTVTSADAVADYTFSFPLTSGTYEPATGQGEIQLDGVLTFVSVAHGFTISVGDPKLVLDGDRGELFATGLRSSAPTAYANASVFTLDLSSATVTLHADGSRTIAGIVPAITTTSAVFPSNYAAGAGPERTPNTFGSFALRVRTAPVAGPQGPKGDAGPTTWLQTAVLKRAPFPDKQRHRIALSTTKGRKVVATGSVLSRTIRVKLADGLRKRLRGVYLLKVDGRSAVRVRVL